MAWFWLQDCPNLPFTLAAEERWLIYIRILGVSSQWRGRGLGMPRAFFCRRAD
jgi:hypothetical protein